MVVDTHAIRLYDMRMTSFNTNSPDRLELMRTFIKISESKNLSSAALSLNTTQPTISRRLYGLEKILGLKLIHRTTHKMKLTEEGQRFYHHAKEIVDKWSRIEEEMLGTKNIPTGLLRVQVPHALGVEKFSKLLTKFILQYDQVNIEWILRDQFPDFSAENLDCAIKVGNIDDPSVVAIKIYEIPRILVTSPKQKKSLLRTTQPSDLADSTWIAFKNHYSTNISLIHQKRLEEITLNIQPRVLTDNLFVMKDLLKSGVGIGVISKWMIEDELKEGSLVQICKDWQAVKQPVYLIYPQSQLKPAKLQRFIELVKKEIF